MEAGRVGRDIVPRAPCVYHSECRELRESPLISVARIVPDGHAFVSFYQVLVSQRER